MREGDGIRKQRDAGLPCGRGYPIFPWGHYTKNSSGFVGVAKYNRVPDSIELSEV